MLQCVFAIKSILLFIALRGGTLLFIKNTCINNCYLVYVSVPYKYTCNRLKYLIEGNKFLVYTSICVFATLARYANYG